MPQLAENVFSAKFKPTSLVNRPTLLTVSLLSPYGKFSLKLGLSGIMSTQAEVKLKLHSIHSRKSMARQLKRWESPRKEGRNNKGKGGSARQRQRRKQMQTLRKKLKEQSDLFDQGKPPRFPFLLGAIAPLHNSATPRPNRATLQLVSHLQVKIRSPQNSNLTP